MRKIANKYYTFLIYITLALVTFVAFESVRQNQFVSYDDDKYVTENPNVIEGLKYESVIWAFTTFHAGNWHPLTWLSHMLDCQLFGLAPSWHHLTNLLLHITNVLLLFWVLNKMTRVVWPSAFVAAAFALHPLHVESVVWVAERKDVLSGLFWMLTIAAYIRYAERPHIGRYLLIFLLFALGLMAKPMLVTLPFVLLLLDYWPLRRFKWGQPGKRKLSSLSESANVSYKISTTSRLLAEKIPLFVLAAISIVLTLIAQGSAGAVEPMETLPVKLRIANALVAYVSYIGKLIYPAHLAVFYPHAGAGLPTWQPILAFIILAVVSVSVIYMVRQRYLAVGWLWYIGTLVPVIGLVQVGSQAMADRYTYLPSIGLFIMFAWGVPELLRRWRYQRIVPATLAALLLVALMICTRVQLRYWRNDLTLFGHAVKETRNNYVMQNLYGWTLFKMGKTPQAFTHLEEALRINPRYVRALNNIAGIFFRQGKLDKAVEYLNKALRLQPNYPQAIGNMGAVYYKQGKFQLAVDSWTKMLKLKPSSIDALNNLARVLATVDDADIRNPAKAVKFAEDAARLTGHRQPELLDTLAAAYAAAGRFPEAVATAEKALELTRPSNKKLTERIQHRLRLYKAGQPYIRHLTSPAK